jgi:hypothetical protein
MAMPMARKAKDRNVRMGEKAVLPGMPFGRTRGF